MTDNPKNAPPPEVAAAAAIVDRWLKDQPPIVGGVQQPPARKLSDAEKLDRARSVDQSKMPEWKDPRT
jgi:hypothetical protein